MKKSIFLIIGLLFLSFNLLAQGGSLATPEAPPTPVASPPQAPTPAIPPPATSNPPVAPTPTPAPTNSTPPPPTPKPSPAPNTPPPTTTSAAPAPTPNGAPPPTSATSTVQSATCSILKCFSPECPKGQHIEAFGEERIDPASKCILSCPFNRCVANPVNKDDPPAAAQPTSTAPPPVTTKAPPANCPDKHCVEKVCPKNFEAKKLSEPAINIKTGCPVNCGYYKCVPAK